MDNGQYTVLCVDDEQNILSALKRLLRKEPYRLLTATSGQEGLAVLAANEVHVVVSDQRMPSMNGTEFLKQVKILCPDALRIILTGYTEVDSITASINEGSIYKFFLKPWNDHNLKLEIRQAVEQYALMETNKKLHDTVMVQNRELKSVNERLEETVAERTQFLEMQNQALQISHAVLDDLPLPIVGVSREMMIALVNKAARSLVVADHPLSVGERMSAFFVNGIEAQLAQYLEARTHGQVTAQGKGGHLFRIEMIPLSGRFSGKGLILTLEIEEGVKR
ncbi:MAG: response regulator [Desulfatitalea sp.]|nr:response regulator [Desulfatitalea sp.]